MGQDSVRTEPGNGGGDTTSGVCSCQASHRRGDALLPLSPRPSSPQPPSSAHHCLSTRPCSLSLKLAEAQMGTWQGAIWFSPKTLKPCPQYLSLPHPNSSLLLCPRVFIHVYHLSIRRAQCPAHRKPASQAWPSLGPAPCLFFFWAGEWGRGRKPVCRLLSSSKWPSVVSFQSTLSSRPQSELLGWRSG